MKKRIHHLILPLFIATLLVACNQDHQTLERSWLGGNYKNYSKSWTLSLAKYINKKTFQNNILFPQDRNKSVVITRVFPQTPAEKFGLQEGDIILYFNNQEIKTVQQLYNSIDSQAPGSQITLTLSRFGEIIEKNVTLGTEQYKKVRYFLCWIWIFTDY